MTVKKTDIAVPNSGATTRVRRKKKIEVDDDGEIILKPDARSKGIKSESVVESPSSSLQCSKRTSLKTRGVSQRDTDDDKSSGRSTSKGPRPPSKPKSKVKVKSAPPSDSDEEDEFPLPSKRSPKGAAADPHAVKSGASSKPAKAMSMTTPTLQRRPPSARLRSRSTTPKSDLSLSGDEEARNVPKPRATSRSGKGVQSDGKVLGKRSLSVVLEVDEDEDEEAKGMMPTPPWKRNKTTPAQPSKITVRKKSSDAPEEVAISRKRRLEAEDAEDMPKKRPKATLDEEGPKRKKPTTKTKPSRAKYVFVG
jgi:hypothetical protein